MGEELGALLVRQAMPLVVALTGKRDAVIDKAQAALDGVTMGAAFVPVAGEASNLAGSAGVDLIQAATNAPAAVFGDDAAKQSHQDNLASAARRGAFSVPFVGNAGQMFFGASLMAKTFDVVGPAVARLVDDLGLTALREAAQHLDAKGASRAAYEEAMNLEVPMLKIDTGAFGRVSALSSISFKRLLGDEYTAHSLIGSTNRALPTKSGLRTSRSPSWGSARTR